MVREEVCQRIHDGQTASKIIAWLHTRDDVLKVLDEYFGEEPVSPQNISEWRKGGYRDWLKRRRRVTDLKALSTYAVKIADAAGGNITGAARSILAGNIMEMLENLDGTDTLALVKAVTALSLGDSAATKAEIAKAKLALDRRRAGQKDQELELARDKFEAQTVTQFLKWAKSPEAQAILESGKTKTVQMAELRQLFFGDTNAGGDAG